MASPSRKSLTPQTLRHALIPQATTQRCYHNTRQRSWSFRDRPHQCSRRCPCPRQRRAQWSPVEPVPSRRGARRFRNPDPPLDGPALKLLCRLQRQADRGFPRMVSHSKLTRLPIDSLIDRAGLKLLIKSTASHAILTSRVRQPMLHGLSGGLPALMGE